MINAIYYLSNQIQMSNIVVFANKYLSQPKQKSQIRMKKLHQFCYNSLILYIHVHLILKSTNNFPTSQPSSTKHPQQTVLKILAQQKHFIILSIFKPHFLHLFSTNTNNHSQSLVSHLLQNLRTLNFRFLILNNHQSIDKQLLNDYSHVVNLHTLDTNNIEENINIISLLNDALYVDIFIEVHHKYQTTDDSKKLYQAKFEFEKVIFQVFIFSY